MKKRIISLLLAVFVIAGMFPLSMPVFAYEPRPELVPDFNRDGVIDAYDREQSMLGADVFTIWLNDDDDAEGTQSEESGDTNSAGHNTPAGDDNDRDYDDDIVNGRCDLLDFFPVLVDVNGVDGGSDYTWKIKSIGSANVNVVFTKLKADKAGDFYTSEAKAMDGDTPLYKADTVSLDTETSLPEGFLRDGRGVLLIEGSRPGEGNIVITGYKSDSALLSFSMPIKVANVEDMYRTINLRQGGSSALTEPTARKDADSDGRQFVFVHGYGVSHDEARGVASDFYKKLWQSGSDSMFTAVEWDSDESSVRIDLYNTNLSLNYYANVENAFAAAEDFKDQCEQLPGRKYLVGHSLGNMLISSAIQDFGLDYEKYFMLGASIAAEAFDKNAIDSGMIDDYWENNIPETERASHWYEKFGQDSDFRSTLTWKGRFEDVKNNVINFYSPSDEFLANCPDDVDSEVDEAEIIKTFTNKLYAKNEYNNYFKYNGYWAFTEKIKGTDYIDVINDYANNILGILSQMNREGGWGLNESYVPGDSSLENTRFTPFEDKRMNYDGTFSIPNDQAFALRARLLADAIPAESYAAGSNPVSTLANINLESYIGENYDWPSYIGEENRENIWKHNDATEVAYYHTHKLFDYIAASPWDKLCAGEGIDGELEVNWSGDTITIKLLNDIKAGINDEPLYVDTWNIKIIIDLNGHSIDVSQAKGSAIEVGPDGDLTITDSSQSSGGMITGGTGQGLVSGDDKLYGGGVLVKGKLTMTGGAVTGNSADLGGGIYVADGGELNIGGTAKIYGNLSKDGTSANNLFLQDSKYITVCSGSDGFKAGAQIGISKTGTDQFTTNGAEADADYFFSDTEGKYIRHTADGGGCLELANAPDISMTVTFDMQGGSDGSEAAEARYTYAMPEITLPKKTGCIFDGYCDESGTLYYNADGESVRNCDRKSDFTLYAKWITVHEHSYTWNNEVGVNDAHILICADTDGLCEEPVKTEECIYVNGVCTVCGAEKPNDKYIARSFDKTQNKVVSTEEFIPKDAKKITLLTTELSGGWYVVQDGYGAVLNKNRIKVSGTAEEPTNIILLDDNALEVSAGIEVGKDCVLNIYGQKNNTGILNAGSIQNVGYGEWNAGIGGGGAITVSGGTVTAASVKGAGIGGKSVTIYGGNVSASSNDNIAIDVSGSDGLIIGDNMEVYDKDGNLVSFDSTMNYVKITEKEPDSLTLESTGKKFYVRASGSDAGTGIVMVALYDSENLNRLLDIKVFELAKTDNLTGTFTQSGYVKAMWWTDFEKMIPLCKPADGIIKQ